MKVFTDYRVVKSKSKLIVALGNFDGVHIGHRELISRCRTLALEKQGIPAVFTFDPHPLKVLQPESFPPLILSKQDKIAILEEAGVEVVVVADFSREIAGLEPREFVHRVLVEGLGVTAVVVGYNYSFGKGGVGTPDDLTALGTEFGFEVDVVPPVRVEGTEASSTLIRQLLIRGEVDSARKLLGYDPFVSGIVVRGAQLGRKLGFPTANLDFPEEVLVPDNGVYLVRVSHGREIHFGVANIGFKPTLQMENPKNIEIHILDFDKNIYDDHIKADFLIRLREEKKFPGLADLKIQINSDIARARTLLQMDGVGNNQSSGLI